MEQLIEYGYNLWIKRKHLQTEYLSVGKYLKCVRNWQINDSISNGQKT